MSEPPLATRPAPPRYVGATLADFVADRSIRFNHLGHWDNPDSPSDSTFEQAQRRMHDVVVRLAQVRDGARLLDVGCGFGGTLLAVDEAFDDMALTGLDVDHRQLALCRDHRPSRARSLAWVAGDACALPFPDGSFDHILSIEAMWHFPSRRSFFVEASRVLASDGRLAVVDILVDGSAAEVAGIDRAELRSRLEQGFAPWPEFDATTSSLCADAAAAGLNMRELLDATAQTKPTYLDRGDGDRRPGSAAFSDTDAVQLFVELHRRDLLRVVYVMFEKQGG